MNAVQVIESAHAVGVDVVLAELGASERGIAAREAQDRLARFGANVLEGAKPRSALRILIDQVKSVVVVLLFAAAFVAFSTGDPIEAAAILVVLAINIALGAGTELRARRAMEALLRLDVPHARVLREGVATDIDASRLVPGDVLVLEAGQSVPADARLLSAAELRTSEAALTGESLPVSKRADVVLEGDTPLADRVNTVYKATAVVSGSGRAVVVATGMRTEVGRIGGLVRGIEDERTPLERRLDALGRRLIAATLVAAVVVAAVGVLRGQPWRTMVETGIALAIAAVPEGLPAVITIALAVGIHRMARRQALVRSLPAVEALGSATLICTDKTGTLTAGEMTVTHLDVPGHDVEVTGIGYAPDGELSVDGSPFDAQRHAAVALALRVAALANDAVVSLVDGAWRPVGDPTDAALLVAARKAGIEREAVLAEWPLVGSAPFSSERQLMATFLRRDGSLFACVKGAPGRIVALCDREVTDAGDRALDDAGRRALLDRNAVLARDGLRVLALAAGNAETTDADALRELTFLGFAGIIDPPAEGVRETIAEFRRAGIRTVMLTGDQRLTAEAVARDLGVLEADEIVVEGRELDALDEESAAARIARAGALSRVSPEAKLKIVSALQRRGDIVAMLGDGVNDAAALKKANVGVAMGVRGTDVAKEASDVILGDDRFATVAAAVEEGRVIYDNIRKFVFYLFSCNLAEVLVLLTAGIVGLPIPLAPLQLLWLNIVTDTFPALSLALEPAEEDVMHRPPRDPGKAILSAAFVRSIALYAALITAVTLAAFVYALTAGGGSARAVTFAFMTLALAQLFHLGTARTRAPLFGSGRHGSNRWAVAAVALVLALQLAAVYVPSLARLLDLVPLTAADWLVIAPLSIVPALTGQLLRLAARNR